jgi:membrane-associated protein
LIVTPFLPGDSLLFAAGAFAGMGKLALVPLAATFAVAATLGDAVNYAIGKRLGKAALSKGWIDKKHVAQTERYYGKYGAKTIVLARFVPIVRTFAPFVAGVGSMDYKRFAAYNVGGALLWTVLFVGAGAAFGNLPVVKSNFKLVVLGIIVVSVIPVIIEVWNARREGQGGEGGAAA